jgi:hypothetical protein
LVIFVAIALIFPVIVFSVEKADKDAILQELSTVMDKNPDILRSTIYLLGDDYARQNKTD